MGLFCCCCFCLLEADYYFSFWLFVFSNWSLLKTNQQRIFSTDRCFEILEMAVALEWECLDLAFHGRSHNPGKHHSLPETQFAHLWNENHISVYVSLMAARRGHSRGPKKVEAGPCSESGPPRGKPPPEACRQLNVNMFLNWSCDPVEIWELIFHAHSPSQWDLTWFSFLWDSGDKDNI